MQAWDEDMDYDMPSSLDFFKNYEYGTLINIKWGLTLVFSVVYLFISVITIKLVFNNKKYVRLAVATYIGITLISGFFIGFGHLFHPHSEKMYSLARYLMGMVQSPVLLMILIPAFMLNKKEG